MPPDSAAPGAIEQQLARIVESQTFKSAERSKALLRFIVEEALAGRASRLKDYTLGVEALGRGEQFDPRTDPIARVEASRLRSRLDLYYASEGAADPIRIGAQRWLRSRLRHADPSTRRVRRGVRARIDGSPDDRTPRVGWAADPRDDRRGLHRGVAPPAPSLAVSGVRLELSTPPTTDPVSIAVSPDGRRIVFVASDDGVPRLWLRALDASEAQPLNGTTHASQPFWSPDSREIGFFADGHVRRLIVDTGMVHDVAPAPVPAGGSWNADGVILFPVTPDSPIFRVTADGDAPRPVTALLAGHSGHRQPHFLPDGERFLFFAAGEPDARGVYVGGLNATSVRKLVQSDAAAVFMPPDRVLYVDRGTLFAQRVDARALTLRGDPVRLVENIATQAAASAVAVAVAPHGPIVYRTGDAGGQRQFIWFDRSGRELSRVGTPESSGPGYASMSPDGRRRRGGRLRSVSRSRGCGAPDQPAQS